MHSDTWAAVNAAVSRPTGKSWRDSVVPALFTFTLTERSHINRECQWDSSHKMLLGYAGVDRITVIFTCTNFPIVKWSIDTVFQPKEREREKKVNFRHPERIMIISMQKPPVIQASKLPLVTCNGTPSSTLHFPFIIHMFAYKHMQMKQDRAK